MGSFTGLHLLSFALCLPLISSLNPNAAPLKSLSLEYPVLSMQPLPLTNYKSEDGSKDKLICERVQVVGIPRLKLERYATSIRIALAPSVVIPERLHSRIQVCLHSNTSLGPCQCEMGEWSSVYKGMWSSLISPYEDKYIDVKFISDLSGSVTITLEEEFQRWRLVCLAVGFILLLAAPIVSSYVPFYYGSSMALGVVLVILILLFQGMKLLPFGRKNALYLTIYGSVAGAGYFILQQFTLLVNSVLASFGLSQEMHSLVSMIMFGLVFFAGAGLGFWIVRKFIILDDGSVDVGIALFMKWSMRVIATGSILLSTPDALLALTAVVFCWVLSSLILRVNWRDLELSGIWSPALRWRKSTPVRSRAEFHSRSGGKLRLQQGTQQLWNSPNGRPGLVGTPVKGLVVSPSSSVSAGRKEYLSTYHKVSNRRKMSKKEWEDFTRESTRQAMAELTSSPQFSDWVIENADRIQLRSDDESSEGDLVGSGSDSTEEASAATGFMSGGSRGW